VGLKSEMASSVSVENESKEPSRENSSDEGKKTHEFMLSGGWHWYVHTKTRD